jgi:hypothetical protein
VNRDVAGLRTRRYSEVIATAKAAPQVIPLVDAPRRA